MSAVILRMAAVGFSGRWWLLCSILVSRGLKIIKACWEIQMLAWHIQQPQTWEPNLGFLAYLIKVSTTFFISVLVHATQKLYFRKCQEHCLSWVRGYEFCLFFFFITLSIYFILIKKIITFDFKIKHSYSLLLIQTWVNSWSVLRLKLMVLWGNASECKSHGGNGTL